MSHDGYNYIPRSRPYADGRPLSATEREAREAAARLLVELGIPVASGPFKRPWAGDPERADEEC